MEGQGFTEEEINQELGKVFDDPDSVPSKRKRENNRTEMLASIADSLVEDQSAAEEFIKYASSKGIMDKVPDMVFDNLVDAVLLFDIDPALEKLVKAEFRRRYYEDDFDDDFDDGEDEY